MCYFVVCDLFWRLSIRGDSQNGDYIKIQYIPRLTGECIVLCSSVNRGISGDTAGAWGEGSIFIGYV
jgi:hypothetical protein